jgi:hypothetical protein
LAAGGFGNVFVGSAAIAKAPFQGGKVSMSFASLSLGRNAIVDIFNGLATVVVTTTITVSGNPGFASLTSADRLIATNKGWTIA